MTTIELRTSIASDLDQMSVEMLESVSRYVRRLRRHARPARRPATAQDRREAAMLFVKNLSVQGGRPYLPMSAVLKPLSAKNTTNDASIH